MRSVGKNIDNHGKRTVLVKDYAALNKKAGELGLDLVSENNLLGAIKCFTEGLSFNPLDHCHYLNRCYCYLRLNKNGSALADAESVLEQASKLSYVFIANLRAGQASFGLEKYRQAESYFRQAVDLNPVNQHAKRELMRVKITRIVHHGFKEKDALLALENHSTTLEAISYLNKNNFPLRDNKIEKNSEIQYYNLDHNVTYLSDEDDESENFERLNKLLNYEPAKKKCEHISVLPSIEFCSTNMISDKSIWVGHLNDAITNDMLKEAFSQFGTINKVFRLPGTLYAFIHFNKSEDVNKAAKNSSYTICGHKLVVQRARKDLYQRQIR